MAVIKGIWAHLSIILQVLGCVFLWVLYKTWRRRGGR